MKCDSILNHSPRLKFFHKIPLIALAILIAVAASPGLLRAQMFSVGNRGPRYNVPQSELYLGVEPMDVTYRGDSSQGGYFAFSGSILRLGYNSDGLDLFLGTGGKVTGIDDVSYFDFGGNIDFGINLYRSRTFTAQIPVRIASRYTNMTSDDMRAFTTQYDRFRFGSLTAGGGLRLMGRPGNDIRLEAGAVPSYGFSFASGGFFGGSLGAISAHASIYFDRLFGDAGLSLGYKYDFRNYDIDEEVYDYRMKGHNILVGITF